MCHAEMAACILIFLICLFQTEFIFGQTQSAMEIYGIVPDVIDVAPANIITVTRLIISPHFHSSV